MGADRPGAGAAVRLQPLTPPDQPPAPAPRLYGRTRGHALRPRQRDLLEHLLPRLRADAASPFAGWAGPRWLEVGFGGGEHALALTRLYPHSMLVACEVFQNGICSLLSRLAPLGGEAVLPGNLRLWDDDARTLIRSLPDATLDRLFLMFPDPWPKSRHARRRFVQPAALPDLARVLRAGAEWRIASDDPTYQAWVAASFADQTLFDLSAPAPARPPDWPPTRYEAKALRAGRQPLYWTARRR